MNDRDERKRGMGPPATTGREARLAAALRENLQRRKAQGRARRAGDADQRPDGLLQPDNAEDQNED